jgi:hypothetical protein
MDEISKIMTLGDCSQEEAQELFNKGGNVIEALALKMKGSNDVHVIKKRRLNATQEFFTLLRSDMEKLEEGIHSGFKKDQCESLEQDEMQIHPEEMVQQNNCYQECQIPSLESMEQIPEIAYQTQSGYFYDLQLSDQKLT